MYCPTQWILILCVTSLDISIIPKASQNTVGTVWTATLSNDNTNNLNTISNGLWKQITTNPLVSLAFQTDTVDTSKSTNSYHYIIYSLQNQTAKDVFGVYYQGIWCWNVQTVPKQGFMNINDTISAYYKIMDRYSPLKLYRH